MDLPLIRLPPPADAPALLLRLHTPLDQDQLPSVDAMLTVLDEDERLRAGRAEHGTRAAFVVGRYLLRCLVAPLLDVDPRTMVSASSCPSCAARGVTSPDHGRPGYLLDGEPISLDLSLSRSRGAVLLAALPTGTGVRIGVDLEAVDAVGFDGFPAVALALAEREAVQNLPQEERSPARARLWVRKEALVKALGTGFAEYDPTAFDVLHDPRVHDVELPTPGSGDTAGDGRANLSGEFRAAVAMIPSST